MRRIFVPMVSPLLLGLIVLAPAPVPAAESALPPSPALATPFAVTVVTSQVQQAAYTCKRAWRCGPYACGWR